MAASTYETKTTTRTIRQIGVCKKCKAAQSRLIEATTTRTYRDRFELISSHTKRTGDGPMECCGRPVYPSDVKGRTTEQPCDARCTSAKGHNCECSCGGKNHGAGYQVGA